MSFPVLPETAPFSSLQRAWLSGFLAGMFSSADAPSPAATIAMKHDRKHPFAARLLENRRLDGPESEKETRHLVLDLKGSNLTFEPGDALGVHPENSPQTVDQILELLGAGGAEDVIA